jgi:hypothetical protein
VAERPARDGRGVLAIVALAVALLACAIACGSASAEGLADEGGAEWHLEHVLAPAPSTGPPVTTPIGLGPVGDVEFWRPDRGLLITEGNGSTIPAGLWAYNGLQWHELSNVCGATSGSIAWAGPDEFWTVSDGRPGQAPDGRGDPAPLEDDTLCHFRGGAVVTSYASLAFQATSYQPMHAAACLSAGDCWFGGGPLPEPQVGSFHLHWNGRTGLVEEEPYIGEGHAVEAMRTFAGALYESVRLLASDPVFEHEPEPPVVHVINPLGTTPTFEQLRELPLYSAGEFPEALQALSLSADGEALWAAAGPGVEPPEGSSPAPVTIIRHTPGAGWTQIVGPSEPASAPFAGDTVRSIAADPGTQAAWVALAPSGETGDSPTADAIVARVSASGEVSDEQTLPSAAEAAAGVGPKGAAAHITCPATGDCWLVTTQGWLFHLTASPGATPPEGVDTDPDFKGLIAYRPPDEGLPQTLPDVPPPESSGLPEAPPPALEAPAQEKPARVAVPLVSNLHVRLVRGLTLELRFHLAVKARVRLLARRRGQVVAATHQHTFARGTHALMLPLDRARWPTKLDLQTHALAKLPTEPVNVGLEHPFTTSFTDTVAASALIGSGPFG